MNKAVIALVAVVLVLAGGVGGYWLARGKDAAAGADPVAAAKSNAPSAGGVVVEASPVAKVALPQGITAVGSLRSDESVTVRPEVAGRISSIHFHEGERVAKGAPLVKLDPSITEAEERQARANLTWAKQKYQRALDLEKQGFISSQAKA